MPENYFMSDTPVSVAPAPSPDLSLRDALRTPAERILWSGLCAVAEYAFDEPASLPRWTLPEETEVVVTEQRVVYRDPVTLETGELRWPWPQHLRVQPGNRDTGRSATVTQIQLVCAGPGDTFPALVFAGGDLTTVGDADRLANVLRQAIARYRVEHANELGIPAPQMRMLSRLVIGPEFSNYQGGEGQTVSLLGAVAVAATPPAPTHPAESAHPAASYPAGTPVDAAHPAAPLPADPTVAIPRAASYPADPHVGASYPAAAPAAAAYPADSGPVESPRVEARPGYAAVPYGSPPVVSGQPAGAAPLIRSAAPAPGHATPGPVPGGYADAVPVAGSHPAPVAGGYPTAAPVPGGYADAPVAGAYPTSAPVSGGRPSPSGPVVGGHPAAAGPRRDQRPAQRADEIALHGRPDLDSRAADLAARVASLVSGGLDLGGRPVDQFESQANLSAYLDVPDRSIADRDTEPLDRAETVRRTAARFAGNAARGRGTAVPRYDGAARGTHRQD